MSFRIMHATLLIIFFGVILITDLDSMQDDDTMVLNGQMSMMH